MKVIIGPYPDSGKREVEIIIDRYDVWNVDETLALVIVPLLKHYRENFTGVPTEFIPDRDQLSFPFMDEPSVIGEDRWSAVVDKMIWSFEQIAESSHLDLDFGELEHHDRRIQEGLDLFARHFQSLWT